MKVQRIQLVDISAIATGKHLCESVGIWNVGVVVAAFRVDIPNVVGVVIDDSPVSYGRRVISGSAIGEPNTAMACIVYGRGERLKSACPSKVVPATSLLK